MERDRFMSAEEAKDFGLVDDVIIERPVTGDADKDDGAKSE